MTNAMLKNQKFGVEVEMNNIFRDDACKAVCNRIGGSNVRYIGTCYDTYAFDDAKGRTWKFMSDSSIAGRGCEMVTPPLNYEDLDLLQEAIRAVKEAGANAHESCGIHVHVDGGNHSSKSLLKMLEIFVTRQDLIYEALQIDEYRKSNWCSPINKELAKETKKVVSDIHEVEKVWYSNKNVVRGRAYRGCIDHSHYNETRYHGLNLHAYFTKGTVEFRLFNSTLHAGRVKAYVLFCLAVSAYAITTQDKNYRFETVKADATPEKRKALFEDMLIRKLQLGGREFKNYREHLTAGFNH